MWTKTRRCAGGMQRLAVIARQTEEGGEEAAQVGDGRRG